MDVAVELALQYARAVDTRDLAALGALMTDDHEFADAMDNAVHGRDAAVRAWRAVLALIPNYTIEIQHALADGPMVALFGRARGRVPGTVFPDDAGWDIPWACQATIRGGRIAAWRTYCDNEPLRRSLARRPAEPVAT